MSGGQPVASIMQDKVMKPFSPCILDYLIYSCYRTENFRRLVLFNKPSAVIDSGQNTSRSGWQEAPISISRQVLDL